ncbi:MULTISPECIES: sulfur carrier protein ThiS [Megasphaera]|jgi:hypothetical protein|uniref:Thiamine biosynthesis protein ThiS n=1 Tax=Megasphaera hutchinsoni TaxID=1588748 RepID=A0A134CJN8_9FIRM|nr:MULTISPECIES: sulfur carrier protein ThiS [Megasphaera]MUP48365.1 thiamine biosynthesis protein ThiS [Veillonellaceae bacterium M2-8]MUP58851.1 thiamine biosynthesis protein ThiS [Veillonellaceae bacterium M2-4]EGS32100.1 thiamine biosynthesis protein ThiS [Megasphaera sp. UPII 135-E]KXB92347.1 thiamine biosynthesis protein ThiS [Megasphaera hutchinsoni]PNH21066.1 thiamine biosynthesis protein ThiS [Megasphaera genomosp. type_2]
MITINGTTIPEKEISLLTYLKEHNLRPERIAIERNGFIVPRKTYENVTFVDGDSIEIVHFVGGG